jgi:multiple antibiotic resistance protein
MTADLRQAVEAALLVFAALFPIVNPVGAAPMFLVMTAGNSADERTSLAKRVAVNGAIVLAVSIFIGTYVLEFFGLSTAVVRVAGGLLLCAFAWDILRGDDAAAHAQAAPSPLPTSARAFYPLTLPLTVGPGSIAVAITIGANEAPSVRSLVAHAAGYLIGIAVLAATIYVAFAYAERMLRRLGESGTNVVLRLSAFILLCIGVQIVWNGAGALIATIVAAPAR